MEELPELYEVVRVLAHSMGYPWTDPRTLITYPAPEQEFQVGDVVRKVGGDHGVVIMAGRTTGGAWRYAVENSDGLIHIFSGKQLTKVD
jgi:hypothetical protein